MKIVCNESRTRVTIEQIKMLLFFNDLNPQSTFVLLFQGSSFKGTNDKGLFVLSHEMKCEEHLMSQCHELLRKFKIFLLAHFAKF